MLRVICDEGRVRENFASVNIRFECRFVLHLELLVLAKSLEFVGLHVCVLVVVVVLVPGTVHNIISYCNTRFGNNVHVVRYI